MKNLSIILIGLVIFLLIFIYPIVYVSSSDNITITVVKTERIVESSGSSDKPSTTSKYLVFTNNEVTKQREEMLKQETINKDIAIQRAMGESEALKIKGQSISGNPKIIMLEWINKWDGTLPKFMSGSSNGIMFNMNMEQ